MALHEYHLLLVGLNSVRLSWYPQVELSGCVLQTPPSSLRHRHYTEHSVQADNTH